ncbi:hypothetical protein KC660_00445 [Candidatus Dojkabacteria bacterium]|uniref:Uncharacterized protein n=1 Tax=Candidatus Dojkabacteria bacterium TaxID=2099670 RepID=A0A955L2S6_9BACT|nr:hypothetical protein [Candidatus Dojkabacteria bacterium]
MTTKKNDYKSIGDLLGGEEFWNRQKKNYISKEFQDYGYRLALKLDDLRHKSLYIKIAKDEDRRIVEEALRFAIDYPKAKNKARIFMWKIKDIKSKEEAEAKKD